MEKITIAIRKHLTGILISCAVTLGVVTGVQASIVQDSWNFSAAFNELNVLANPLLRVSLHMHKLSYHSATRTRTSDLTQQ